MASESDRRKQTIEKRTRQGGSKPKTSSMNKSQRHGYKKYRGQGK